MKKNRILSICLCMLMAVNILGGNGTVYAKAKNANKFLKAGDKVKVSLKFKGREVRFVEKGKETILKFVEMLEEGRLDKEPKLEGRFLNVIVLPKDKK